VDLGRYFAILPSSASHTIDDYCKRHNVARFPIGQSYSSGDNEEFLTVAQLRELIAADPALAKLGGPYQSTGEVA